MRKIITHVPGFLLDSLKCVPEMNDAFFFHFQGLAIKALKKLKFYGSVITRFGSKAANTFLMSRLES